MKILHIIFAALICSPMLATAVPNSVITGPYNISFDLGVPTDIYKVNILDPIEKESLGGDKSIGYKITIQNEADTNRAATIDLVQSKIEFFLEPKDMQMGMRMNYPNSETSDRKIDGKSGAICAYDSDKIGLKVYITSYYPFNDTTAFIGSSYPWDEGTLSLLKTIHIEKINQTL